MAKKALGKGLGALIKGATSDTVPDAKVELRPGESVSQVPINDLVPSPLQPRKHFAEGSLDELRQSIDQLGIIQPLIIRRVDGQMELIAGERRWRASKLLGLETVPVIERPSSDREVLEMALIENLQRQDLNAIEEAEGYVRLAKDFGLKQDIIAKRVGKSRASVANSMRLLDLQPSIQRHLADGHLTVGHAKAILGVKVPNEQIAVSDQILRQNMTVRAAEKFVQDYHKTGEKKSKGKRKVVEPHITAIQNRLRDHFATQTLIHHTDKKGKIEIEYYGNDDLGRILNLLGLDLD